MLPLANRVQRQPVSAGHLVLCLQIADDYTFLQPELVALLEARVAALVPRPQSNSR